MNTHHKRTSWYSLLGFRVANGRLFPAKQLPLLYLHLYLISQQLVLPLYTLAPYRIGKSIHQIYLVVTASTDRAILLGITHANLYAASEN